jgi:hypothetical protein
MIRRWSARALAVALIATGLSAAWGGPAQASYSSCSSGYVCLWYENNGNTGSLMLLVFRNPGTCYNLASFDKNRAESFYNHLSNGHHVQFYDLDNCTGPLLLRAANNSGGPHAAGVHDNFAFWSEDRANSIFFNNG